jgi:hypothetical protein
LTLSIYELEDLHKAVSERIEDGLLPALTQANRTGELGELLRLLGMGDLVGGDGGAHVVPTKVVVMGASVVKEDKLRSIAKKHGIMSKDIEFALDYERIKHYPFYKLRDSLTYRAILVGPMPHSTSGKRDASSAIAEMENHPEKYPPVIRMHDANGLKITNNSFAQALDELPKI